MWRQALDLFYRKQCCRVSSGLSPDARNFRNAGVCFPYLGKELATTSGGICLIRLGLYLPGNCSLLLEQDKEARLDVGKLRRHFQHSPSESPPNLVGKILTTPILAGGGW